jgi:hypothetical protein
VLSSTTILIGILSVFVFAEAMGPGCARLVQPYESNLEPLLDFAVRSGQLPPMIMVWANCGHNTKYMDRPWVARCMAS